MTMPMGDPQGTQARALDSETKHPVHLKEAPTSYYRKQILVVALVIGLPLLVYAIAWWR